MIGYEVAPAAQTAANVRLGATVAWLAAAEAADADGATKSPALFWTEAKLSPDALASA